MKWPKAWQKEAIQAVVPYIGTDDRLEIWVDDPDTAIDGTCVSGHLYQGADGVATMIYDRSGRPDVYPWRLLGGPVLEVFLLPPKRPKVPLYRHPRWEGREGRDARIERARLRRR